MFVDEGIENKLGGPDVIHRPFPHFLLWFCWKICVIGLNNKSVLNTA